MSICQGESLRHYDCFTSQQTFASSQHFDPSEQHAGPPLQQALFSAQQACPFWKQPSFESASQQPLGCVQQASFREQQSSTVLSAAKKSLPTNKPNASNDPDIHLINIVLFLQ
jgi:hypothetical protein